MQQQQDIYTLVTNEYIVKHPLFDLLCQFYAILAKDAIVGLFSYDDIQHCNYKCWFISYNPGISSHG